MKQLITMAGLLAGVAFAVQDGERGKIIGAWETQQGADTKAVWTLAENGDKFHITVSENDRKVSEIECNTAGRECTLKDAGKGGKVSMWFNGPKLVVMETRGSDVLKRRFQATGDGSAMDVEVIPIVPQGKTEVVHLTRAQAAH